MRSLALLILAASACVAADLVSATHLINEAHNRGDFDGVVVISENGHVVFTSAVGTSDRAAKVQMRPDTLFRLASLTKQVTALLVMQEVTAGNFRLDKKPGYGLPEITIRQLLQHVSGLPNPSDGPENVIPAFYLRSDEAAADMMKTAKGFCSGKPKRSPGLQFEYNNCDYIVLGAMLEELTQKSYAQIVRERVIEPLGLRSWGVYPSDRRKAPEVAVAPREPFQNPATYGAAGALYGNALDVAKWNEALLSSQLLSSEATTIMFEPGAKLQGEALGSWAYDVPGVSPRLRVIERQGDMGSTRLLSLLLPSQHASIVIIANTDRADLFDTYSQKGLGYTLLQTIAKKN